MIRKCTHKTKKQPNLKKLSEACYMRDPFEKIALLNYFVGALITANEISQERIDHAVETAFQCFNRFYPKPPISEAPDSAATKQIHDAEMLKRCLP